MKRNYKLIICLLSSIIFLLPACNKFLDVQPEDKVLEDQLFTSSLGIQTVLNGLYINLAKNELYGEQLTLSTVEVLAQRYNIPSTHDWNKVATYKYEEKPTIDRLEGIWVASYSNILNINAFLENLEKYKGVVNAETEALYKGEAIAMRALLHLDLLRLYGPRYSTADSTKQSLPYYTISQNTINPLLPANVFMDKVLEDLNEAEILLEKDNIITGGVNMAKPTDQINFLLNNRNYRMNYYAVMGLKARAYLYRGDKASALKYAKSVIDVSSKFPWTTSNNALSEKQNPDRVFSTEMLFGVMNTQLYSRYNSLFEPSIKDDAILAPIEARVNTVFESNENDYRFNLNWARPTTGQKSYKTFYKYADIVDKEKPTFRFTVPVLKISEIYYIAAESEADVANGLSYLNTVRNSRGLPNLASNANLNTELQKEHQKDFYGEGQLFYFYKRRNVASIPNGSATSGNVTVNYNIPMPQSEALFRQ